jgi:hypothetical protein
MRTPAGTQCRHYYEDFNRGRQTQECRLIKRNPASLPWRPEDCAKCSVPDILRANGSPDLRVELTIEKRFGFFRRLSTEAYCLAHVRGVDDPRKGCPDCQAAQEAAEG